MGVKHRTWRYKRRRGFHSSHGQGSRRKDLNSPDVLQERRQVSLEVLAVNLELQQETSRTCETRNRYMRKIRALKKILQGVSDPRNEIRRKIDELQRSVSAFFK